MLNERDSKDLNYDWEVAESLGEPKTVSIWHILVKHTAN